MTISPKDAKVLWARSAGRCAAPNCHSDLTPKLARSGNIVMGEMAHVIGRQPSAARSNKFVGADDSYDNLILLCPNHHTLIDKAPGDYSVPLLKKWKTSWEAKVKRSLEKISSTRCGNVLEMRLWTYFNFDLILRLLNEYSKDQLVPANLYRLGMLDSMGFPKSNPSNQNARTVFSTWENGGRSLQVHFSSLVEELLQNSTIVDLDAIWGIRKLEGFLSTNSIVFSNRRSSFKTIDKSQSPEHRSVTCFGQNVQLVYHINTWQIYSGSSFDLHFRGSSKVASLLLVRSVEREVKNSKSILVIKATPIAIGTGFWSPHDRTPGIASTNFDLDEE